MNIEKMAELAIDAVRGYVEKAMVRIDQRLESFHVKHSQEISRLESVIKNLPTPKDGEPGKSVNIEDVRLIIEQAVEKQVKKCIEAIPLPVDGRDGKDGRDGIDAFALEILPVIDEERTYPRGTYAQHKGGLWRAFENTHAMRGWECIIEGLHEINISSADLRNYTISLKKSSGALEEKTFAIPVMIYRGVYQDGLSLPGDTVTYAGSLWHCNEETNEKPGTGSKAWTLAAKRGRDANTPAKIKGDA